MKTRYRKPGAPSSLRQILVLVTMLFLSAIAFPNALRFLPRTYSSFIYVPDLSKAYEAFKATPIGGLLLADSGIGLESLITGVLEQQLLSMKFTLADFDLFQKELLLVADADGKGTVVLGPVKNPTRMRKILEGFLDSETLKQVRFTDNYFILTQGTVGGGRAPANLNDMLRGNLAVLYGNINDGKVIFEGWGYVRVENNGLVVYQKMDAKNNEARNALRQIQNARPVDVLGDRNVGGDLLVFVNRAIPDVLKGNVFNILSQITSALGANVSGVMYASADISSTLTQVLNEQQGSGENVTLSMYTVMFGSNLKMPSNVSRYVTIGNERYGVVTSDLGIETYVLVRSDRMITYTVPPNKYKPGDRAFFTANYDPKYFAGIMINLEPLINAMLGRKVKSSATLFLMIEGDSLVARGAIR